MQIFTRSCALIGVFIGSTTDKISIDRDEQLVLLKNIIKKRLPKRVLPSKVWFFAVTLQKVYLNPLVFTDTERFFESLQFWKDRKLKRFLEMHPGLSRKQIRHKKVPAYNTPMRL